MNCYCTSLGLLDNNHEKLCIDMHGISQGVSFGQKKKNGNKIIKFTSVHLADTYAKYLRNEEQHK